MTDPYNVWLYENKSSKKVNVPDLIVSTTDKGKRQSV